MHIQTTISFQRALTAICHIFSLKYSTLLAADLIFRCTKKLVPVLSIYTCYTLLIRLLLFSVCPTEKPMNIFLKSHINLLLPKSLRRLRPNPWSCITFRNNLYFLRWGFLSPNPNPKPKYSSSPSVRDCLLKVFAASQNIRRLYLPPSTEEAQCHGERNPHNIATIANINHYYFLLTKLLNMSLS
jgi:hypothetical protein